MDLMKLLKAKSNHLKSAVAQKDTLADKILTDLDLQFDTFLRDVSKLDEFKQSNPLQGVSCRSGELILEDDYGVLDKSRYLFLRIPGHPGLLLEETEDSTLSLFVATEARPIQRHWNGSEMSQVVFVRRPQPLVRYQILEQDMVRDLSNSKTLVGLKFFEHLVEKLIVQLGQN